MLINCPTCGQTLSVNATAGMFRCPKCHGTIQINPTPSVGAPYVSPAPVPMSPYGQYRNPSTMGGTGNLGVPQLSTVVPPFNQGFNPMDPLEAAFASISGGRDALNVTGLKLALQKLNVNLSNEICNMLFIKHDADGSGSIQLREFREIHKEIKQWIDLFNALDDDHSGTMEFPEFSNAMKRLQFRISETMYRPLFQHIDNLHREYIDLNGFIKVVSIIQLVEMKFSTRDTMRTGKITVDLNGILDFILCLPLCFVYYKHIIQIC